MANTFTLDELYGTPKQEEKPKVSERRIAAEQLAEGPLREAVSALPWAQAATGFAPLFGLPSGYDITQEQALTTARQNLGLSGEESKNMAGRAGGAVLRTLTNPSTIPSSVLFGLAGPTSSVAGKTVAPFLKDIGIVPSMLTSLPAAAGSEAGGEVGGMYGEQIGRAISGQEGANTGRMVGQVGGAVAGGVGTAYPIQFITQTLPKLFSGAKQVWNGGSATVGDIAEAAGGKKAGNVAAKAFEADPVLGGKLLRAQEIKNQIGVDLPIVAASESSSVLNKAVQSQSAKDPSFLGYMKEQERKAREDILSYAVKQFGAPSTERVLEATKPTSLKVKTLQENIDNIDNELVRLGSQFERVSESELATKIPNLLKSREELVRKEIGPVYENAINKGMKDGISLSPAQTESLYSFAEAGQNADIFKTFPSIYNKVIKTFGPEVLEDGTEVFKSASLRDLDSLKREVNKALYQQNMSNDTRRVVVNMRNAINDVVDELPASFKDAYRGADAEYLRRIKVPFSARNIEDIGSKAFVEQTIPALTRYSTGLQQFLDVAGDEGIPLVRDAFMYQLGQTRGIVNPETGAINPKVLNQFIRNNQDTLKLVPSVADEISNIHADAKGLVDAKNKVTESLNLENRNQAEGLFNQVFKKGLDSVYGDFLVKPESRSIILKELQGNKAAEDGFKAYALSKLTQSGKTLDTFDQYRQPLTDLFGKNYVDNVEALAEATQKLYENPVKLSVPTSTTYRTKLEEKTGMSPESLVSLARRQITSTFQKGTILFSKYFQNQASQQEMAAIQDLLKDSTKVQKVREIYEKAAKTDSPHELTALAKDFSKAVLEDTAKKGYTSLMLGLTGVDDVNQPEPAKKGTPSVTVDFLDNMNFVPVNPITQ